MESPVLTTAPAKLYALLLKVRPLERGSIMPFSGELVHGAWLSWIRDAAPDVATMLHDGNKRRLFTCSSLLFPLPSQRIQHLERENAHVPLDPEKTYALRLTLLLGELFPLFYNTLLHSNMAALGKREQAFMKIGKQSFALEEVVISRNDTTPWIGVTSFAQLLAEVQALKLHRTHALTLLFDSLTTFNRSNLRGDSYEKHYARLPFPHYVFPGLARRWQELAPPELAEIVQKELIEQYIEDERIVIDDYELKTHYVSFVRHPQKGFVGSCTYHLRGSDENTTPEYPLSIRQQILLLARFAFYTGCGYKTTMGMGRVRMIEGRGE